MNNEITTEEKSLKVYELKEVCDLLKINLQVLRRYIKDGEIKASKIGRKYIITEANLQKFINGNEVKKVKPIDLTIVEYLVDYADLTSDAEIDIDDQLIKFLTKKDAVKPKDRQEVEDILERLLTTYLTITTSKGTLTLTLVNNIVHTDDGITEVEVNKDAMKLLATNREYIKKLNN